MDYGKIATPAALLAAATDAQAVAAGRGAPVDYNGLLGNVDLARPVDFVDPTGRIVVTAGNYSVKHNMAYQLWVAQGCPNAGTALAEEHINKALPYLFDVISRGKIYSVMNASANAPVFRASDQYLQYAAIPGLGDLETAADKIFAWLHDNEEREASMGLHGKMILYSMVANAIHRLQNDGHSWYTKNTENMRTLTGKTIAVAGSDKREFKLFMLKHGHDGNHHLSDACLNTFVDAITGRVAVRIPAAVRTQYCGRPIGDRQVHEVFMLSESATDRWPPSELGKGAAIVGLELCSMMVAHISSKLLVTNHAALVRNIGSLRQAIGDRAIGRAGTVALSSRLSAVTAFAHGYTTQAGLFESSEEYAITNHAARNKGAEGSGKALANSILAAPAHTQAVAAAALQGLNALSAAVTAAANIISTDTGAALMVAEPVGAMTAKTGDSPMESMLKMQMAQRGGAEEFKDAMG